MMAVQGGFFAGKSPLEGIVYACPRVSGEQAFFVDHPINDQPFCFIGVYTHNYIRDRTVSDDISSGNLAGDWNVDIDRTGTKLGTNNPKVKIILGLYQQSGSCRYFQELTSSRGMWTCTNKGSQVSALRTSYFNRVLVVSTYGFSALPTSSFQRLCRH